MITATIVDGIERMICESEDDWLEQRLCSVGASETPSLIGIGFANTNAATVWESKVRPQYRSNEEVELLMLGHVMEPAIREACRRCRKMAVTDPMGHEIWKNSDYPRMHASPDGFVTENGQQGVLELKNVSSWMGEDWADGEAAPLRVQAQIQHQLACTGMRFGYAAGLIGGNQLRVVRSERDEAFISAIQDCVAHFWTYVEAGELPPIDGLRATAEVLKRLHPDDNGETIELPEDLVPTVDRLMAVKELIKDAKKEKDALQNQLLVALGDNTYGQLPDGRTVSWKTQSHAGYTVEPTSFRVLRTHANHPERKRKSR